MALVKCGTASSENKIELMFDTLHLEWSQHLASYIIFCLKWVLSKCDRNAFNFCCVVGVLKITKSRCLIVIVKLAKIGE